MCWQLFEILLSSSTPFFLREFITSAEGSEGNPALVNVASPLSCLKKKIIALSSSLSASTETNSVVSPSPRLAVRLHSLKGTHKPTCFYETRGDSNISFGYVHSIARFQKALPHHFQVLECFRRGKYMLDPAIVLVEDEINIAFVAQLMKYFGDSGGGAMGVSSNGINH